MSHPQVLKSRKLMKDDEGNTLKSYDNHEGLKTLPLNAMECAILNSTTLESNKSVAWFVHSPKHG